MKSFFSYHVSCSAGRFFSPYHAQSSESKKRLVVDGFLVFDVFSVAAAAAAAVFDQRILYLFCSIFLRS
jgi:hypothetical protein